MPVMKFEKGRVLLSSGGSRISPRREEASTYDFAKFSKNCMKLKEFGPPGRGWGESKILLCRSPTAKCGQNQCHCIGVHSCVTTTSLSHFFTFASNYLSHMPIYRMFISECNYSCIFGKENKVFNKISVELYDCYLTVRLL